MHIVIQKINYLILVKLKYCSNFSLCTAKANAKTHVDQNSTMAQYCVDQGM